MNILILKHAENEGPGTLGDYLRFTGFDLETLALHNGDSLPSDLRDCCAVVSLGGPMNVDDEGAYPFLASEKAFLRNVVEADMPVLGVCLGAQLIASAFGAEVRRGMTKELGWGDVILTEAGREDRLFEGIEEAFPVFQWHEDCFVVPDGGELLASSVSCPEQVFRIRNAYGLQFHIEVDDGIIVDWFRGEKRLEGYLRRYREIEEAYNDRAGVIYRNFVDLIGG